MLDYNLVTPKATYRMVRPDDIPVLKRLVAAFYLETPYGTRSRGHGDIEATVRELGRNKEKGTLFVFEKDERIVGYAILINYWSNEFGATLLMLDEIYVLPEERGNGISGDFIDLLAKVAPQDAVLMQLEMDPSNKRLVKFYKECGFVPTKALVMTRPIKRSGG
jgi:GNAT superfamily N-acetyltransferase